MGDRGDLSVLILDGNCQLSVMVLRSLAGIPNLKVHVLASYPETEVRFCRHRASFRLHAEPANDADYLKAIAETAQEVKADVLLPVSAVGIGFAAKHASDLKKIARLTTVPDLETFDTADDKWELARLMQQEGIPAPHTVLCTRDAAFMRALDSMDFPVLIKPTRSSHGTRIQSFRDRASLTRFLTDNHDDERPYIVQSRIPGYDIDCSVLCKDGRILAHTIQKALIENPVPFRTPLALEFVQHEAVLSVVRRLMRALNFNGVAHVDLRVDTSDDSVKVIEINPRYWASLPGSVAAGVNFPELALNLALDKSLPDFAYRPRRYMDALGLLKKWAHRASGVRVPAFRFSEIGWDSLFSDPLPSLWMSWKKIWKPFVRRVKAG